MLAGIASASIASIAMWIVLEVGLLPIELQIVIAIVTIISSALGGWMAKQLADSIAKTGVLSSYAVGKEHQEEI